MKMSLLGIDRTLEIYPGFSLLNIRQKQFYRLLIHYFLHDLTDNQKNDIVFFNDKEERINGKRILYIHDLQTYHFDTKNILDKCVKPYLLDQNSDVLCKEAESNLYQQLLQPVISYVNTFELDFDIKPELDINFYLKIVGFDFSINDDLPLAEKLISIIKLNAKINNTDLFVLNRSIPLLTDEDLTQIKEYLIKNSISLLLIDSITESEVVIANNLIISDDYGAYSVSKGNI